MAKKNRNNKKPQNQPQSAPKPEVKAEVTVADVVESKTESQFEKNKEAVIKKFMDDIGILEEEKKLPMKPLPKQSVYQRNLKRNALIWRKRRQKSKKNMML